MDIFNFVPHTSSSSSKVNPHAKNLHIKSMYLCKCDQQQQQIHTRLSGHKSHKKLH